MRGCTGEGGRGTSVCEGVWERRDCMWVQSSIVCVCTRKERAEIKFVNVNASMLQRMLCTGRQ